MAPGGKAIEATGDDAMSAMQMIRAEKATAVQGKGKGTAGPLQEVLGGTLPKEEARQNWEAAVEIWSKLRIELKEQGRFMKEAGNKPRLQDFLKATAPIPPQTD